MDPYKVLGVSSDASDEEIKKAYRNLTKKYHPDLHPNDPNAEKKYAEINAAYDAIQKGTANSYQQQSYQSNGYDSSWNSWTNWQQQYWQQQSNQRYSASERTEYTAAENYIRNGMYAEAINALNQVSVSERDGKWYYLMAYANAYIGNKVAALEYAKRACEIEPDNEQYRRLLNNIQSGSNYYDGYTVKYNSGLDTSKLCMTLCALNACLGGRACPCGYVFCL